MNRSFPLLARIAPMSALLVLMSSSGVEASVPKITRIGMVDLQRILEETQAGKRARSELEASAKSKQQQVDKQRSSLEAEAAKLRSLQGKALADAQKKLQAESMEWQKNAYGLEQSLAAEEGKLLEQIYGNTQRIVKKIAESEKLDLVLIKDQMTVIYTDENLDLTSEIIKRYDKAHPN